MQLGSPLLWYRDQGVVDFGDFEQTLFRRAAEPFIGVSFSIMAELRGARDVWYREQASSVRFDVNLRIGAQEGRSFVKNFELSCSEDRLALAFANDLSLQYVQIGTELVGSLNSVRANMSGLFPQMSLSGEDLERVNQKLVSLLKRQAATPDVDESISRHFIRYGSMEDVRASLARLPEMIVRLGSGTRNANKKFSPSFYSDVLLREAQRLLFARDCGDVVQSADSAMKRFVRGIRYLGPFRRAPERFYRKAELAIDRIDYDGSNLAMFLDSLHVADREAFSEWLYAHFGILVSTRIAGSHIVLEIRTGDAKERFNLMDMGFGISQLLPVAAQCWLAARQGAPGRMRLDQRDEPPPSLLAIEQPELHLHPHHQAQLADMFTSLANVADSSQQPLSMVVETHSEAMIDRFGELIADGKLSPNDISLLFFEKLAERGESDVRSIEFSADGMLPGWPIGFFRS